MRARRMRSQLTVFATHSLIELTILEYDCRFMDLSSSSELRAALLFDARTSFVGKKLAVVSWIFLVGVH